MTTFFITIGLLIALFIIYKFKKTKLLPILMVKISTSNETDYLVEFSPLNEQVKQIEYLRISLNFISRMYLIKGNLNENNRVLIRSFLRFIASSEI